MPVPAPRSLSPSKVSAFTTCPLAFRFATIDRIPEPATRHTALGTLVHRALEGLFWDHPAGKRTPDVAHDELHRAWPVLAADPEVAALGLGKEEADALLAEASGLLDHYFALEQPDTVQAVATEIVLEADVGGVRLRGIIDRLDREPDGSLTVVDYKTGRVPSPASEQARLAGVQIYALLCQEVLGQRPSRVRLLYLRGPVSIEAVPTDQQVTGVQRRTAALWSAITRACDTEDFRPRPSPLCNWCHFRPACPAHGGDPADVATLAAPGRTRLA